MRAVPPIFTAVTAARHVAFSVKVMSIALSTSLLVTSAVRAGGGGAGMLNVADVTGVNPVDVKEMVAPVTAAALVAVKPL